ncbi:hypothetical protein JKF63_06083 [Porcisia hertigi]|uniref:Uncharacterized protein n=1 Tax=Porcisia hertigi TaxID=2761500 RepID=A0A836LGZ6_9TRYP|nr:hypothetical protein JKF63_06083 [Porcisia hertigi]
MNVYTSDGLLVSGGVDPGSLSAEKGQQLISIYRLFLQLHHAGTSTMRIKDMIRAETPDGAGEQGSGVGGDKSADRRGGGAGRGGAGSASVNWNSMIPPTPETTAYTSSIAAVSTGIPYPMFLLSSNAIPETHRLRGFTSAMAVQQQAAAVGNSVTTVATKNNNRSANGCEEIALRWSLLTQQTPCSANLATASAASVAGSGVTAASAVVTPTSMATLAKATAYTETTPDIGTRIPSDRTDVVDASQVSVSNTAKPGSAPSTDAVAVSPACLSAPSLCAYSSGWTAAELQVHSTKQVMVCTATELLLDLAGDGEDGNAPLLFCCTTQPAPA